jgi:hypothetical protein
VINDPAEYQMAIRRGHSDKVTNAIFSPEGNLVLTCHQRGRALLWQASGPEMELLLGIYITQYEIGAAHWLDPTHIVLVDMGGPKGYPCFYQLKLEGMWEPETAINLDIRLEF